MAIRKIVKEGYESLTKISKPVTAFDERLKKLVEDMQDTLKKAEGAGLAAPQIGVIKRVAIIVDSVTEEMITLVNPEILSKSGSQTPKEGCLSIPGVWAKTDRPAVVTVKAQDITGKFFTLARDGITAVAICHEVDHLDGILFRNHVIEYIEEDE